jgi:ABC-type phosphate transport system substrate-binding protein
LAVGASLAAGALTLGAFAVPAGATLTPPFATTIVGAGSSTTYFMMQDMDELFNRAPGCEEFVPFPSASSPQPLDQSCVPNLFQTHEQAFESGVTNAFPENPFNDVSVQESPIGSSNGIAALEDQGAHGATANSFGTPINVANNVSYARSSRALGSGDLKGLNFVAYAQDGVPWFHYTATTSLGASASSGVTSLSQAQLQGIYNGTINNWSTVGGANAPIVVVSAQEGSGTQSTFKTFLGFDPSSASNPVNCYTPSGGSNTCVGPEVIFENEDAQIQPNGFTSSQQGFVTNNPVWGASNTATSDQIKSDAIFFFSFGKFDQQCKAGDCGGSPLPAGTTNAVGQVNGIAASQTTILENTFPVDRFLYNVYSNGSNSNIPKGNNATMNYVSELGFICNVNHTQTFQTVDFLTGNTYLNEIQAVIENNGFYPLSGGASTGTINNTEIDEGSLPHPATTNGFYPFEDAANHAANGDPLGFCLTTTTDGNANS